MQEKFKTDLLFQNFKEKKIRAIAFDEFKRKCSIPAPSKLKEACHITASYFLKTCAIDFIFSSVFIKTVIVDNFTDPTNTTLFVQLATYTRSLACVCLAAYPAYLFIQKSE